MKRTALRRGTSQLKRSPLARVGRKKKDKAIPRAFVVELVHRRDGRCQFNKHILEHPVDNDPDLWFACQLPLDVHEIVPRSVWPDGDLDVTNCVLLCRAHHTWIDSHRDLAAQLGLYRRER